MNALYVANLPQIDRAIAHYRSPSLARQNLAAITDPVELVLASTTAWTDTLTKFIASMFGLFDGQGGSPADKKAAVLAAVDKFYVDLIEPQIQIAVGRPVIFLVIKPILHQTFRRLAEGIYDGLSTVLTRVTQPAAAGSPSHPATPSTPGTPPGFEPY